MSQNHPRRYLLLSPPPVWKQPVEGVVTGWIQSLEALTRNHDTLSWYDRKDTVRIPYWLIAAKHLNLPGVDDAARWVEFGTSAALDYFWGDWKIDPEEDPDDFPNMKTYNEQRSDPWWFKEFAPALASAILSERSDAVSRLCEWPWAELKPEYSDMGGPLEDEYALMYLVMASGLRDTPMEGVDVVRSRVRKCRQKRPRLLLDLWEAVEDGDQAAFDKSMIASLKHHDAGPGTNGKWSFTERLAEPQSIMHQVALRRGLRPTDLPENLAIYLVTRESLGLDS